tara:strand:+ start:2052 stop:3119 length:1068 start_codon:yes stop_codon:yes gene_type:complete
MNIAIINSLGRKNYLKCLNSLKNTINIKEHKIYKFYEKKFRGHTLNNIIAKIGTNKDILIVADDVKFTPGWYQKLKRNEHRAEMWGTSMLYPDSKKIQDNGYELVKYNENTFLRPLKRGDKFKKNPKQEWKYTDCVCGCFLYLNKKTFKFQKKFFPKYGMNRWDEYTFILKAKSKGLKLGILNHYMYHEGTSTKNNPNKKLSSTSYQIEKEIWKKLEQKLIDKKKIKRKIKINFQKKIFNLINNKKNNILLYGAGIFSENLLSSKLIKNNKINFTSSLKEEIGIKIHKKYKILNFSKLNIKNYNVVIITPSDSADNIFKKKFNEWINNNWKGNFYKVKERKTSYYWNYSLDEIKN